MYLKQAKLGESAAARHHLDEDGSDAGAGIMAEPLLHLPLQFAAQPSTHTANSGLASAPLGNRARRFKLSALSSLQLRRRASARVKKSPPIGKLVANAPCPAAAQQHRSLGAHVYQRHPGGKADLPRDLAAISAFAVRGHFAQILLFRCRAANALANISFLTKRDPELLSVFTVVSTRTNHRYPALADSA